MVTGDSQGDSQGPGDGGSDPLIGRTLNGRFSILEPIGVGGMGRVYRAQQTPLDRVVALKVLNPNFPTSKDPGFQKRFLREASLSSKLRHPNTVTVIDYGQTDDGIYYIAMEYLEGRTLGQVLAETGPLPWARALSIAQQICRSLREAHNLGVVHRDLKPANIMVLNESDQDLVKVLDFGLVKSIAPTDDAPNPEITQSGTFLGSPAYMAPEQARNEADIRSDVYSLGVMLYQMLVGRPPFVSKDHIELIFAHHKELPPAFSSVRPDLQVPQDIESLVRKCLEKDPARRFQTMEELLEAMRGASMAAGGHSGIFKRPGGQNTTGPHKTPLFAGITGDNSAENNTLAVDISVVVPPDMQKTRRRTLLLGGLVGGGIAVALTGGLLLSSGVFSRSEPKQEPVAAAPVAAPTEKATDQVVRFRLMSQPTGARVVYKGEERGTTPLLLEIPKEKGQDTVTAEFTFSLDGYQAETVITGGSGEVVFAQKLQRARGGSSRVASSSRNQVEHVSGTAGDRSTVTALGSMSAPVMLESEPPPAPVPGAAPKQVEKTAAEGAGGGALAVPVLALSNGAASTGDGPVPFQEGMPRPVELRGKDIVYTREALAARVEGTMVVKCTITQKGQVENCRVIKGLPHMNEAVVQSLQSRTYKPILLQGKAVAVDYVFNIRLVAPRRR
ncbi:serine/threonine-protein kinase [Archangium gephyra]|uniref:non-specific serine/threonine protein kinase n=1 Tax=Archangium gephyra TaxID=48 RepID=A0AAC8TIC4_9BACT|nr:TonB family protein [Archangium gephyra]AKJ05446.1 Serine/threonine protein kinase PrkC, regulator of stationary phase [Archangium gephyra]REG36129.1 serine/threonine-protein kinase [Archangium gephyra]